MNLDDLLGEVTELDPLIAHPEVFPPSIRDCEMASGCFDMFIPLADPCPGCGAFRMRVGDWVCSGFCDICVSPEDYS